MRQPFVNLSILRKLLGSVASVGLLAGVSACQPVQSLAEESPVLQVNTYDWVAKKTAILSYLNSVSAAGHTLSGVQVNEYEAFIECTSYDRLNGMSGKNMAVMGMELMFAIEYAGYADHLVRLAKEHADAGGIITMSWHARSPLRTCPRGEYYECSKMMISDADMALMLTDGTRENKLFKKDIAAVVPVFKRMQDAGIPILWRPYHEMNGGWFWWGKTDRFADLWSALYHELEEVHGLDNLIWVWSSAHEVDSPKYAPPAGMFDMVGADLYESANNAEKFVDRYKDARVVSATAPFAFTEVGKIPSDRVLSETRPAYVLLWGGDFMNSDFSINGNCNACNSPEETKAFLKKSSILSLDDIPAKTRVGWTSQALMPRKIHTCNFPN